MFGGQSAEHEISILSARNVLAALDRERFDPLLIGIDPQGRWVTQDAQRLLDSARDPRLVRIEPGAPTGLPILPRLPGTTSWPKGACSNPKRPAAGST